LLAEVQSGSNSGEQLLPIHASSAESEGTAAFVSSRASSGHVRFVDQTNESPSIKGFPLGSGESLLPGELLHSCSSFSSISRVWRGSTSFPRTPAPGPWARIPCGRDLRRRCSCSARLAGRPWLWARPCPREPSLARSPPTGARALRGVAGPLAEVELAPPPAQPLAPSLMSMEFLREEEKRKEEDGDLVI
jgi:hypothetical protein